MNKTMMLAACAVAATAFSAKGDFAMDRSVMSDKYWSIWNDEVQAKIDADIEKYRKADATVEVAAPDGAEVKVEQVGHAFYFGAHIFNFNQLDKSLYGPMPADYAYKSFLWAQKYLSPKALFTINDYNMGPFFEQVDDLLRNGARIDVVGSQMHLFNPAESVNIARGEGPAHLRPAAVAERFRILSQANRPIHLSEITITAPDNSQLGQLVQAIIMRNLYRAWFSVEKMNGITWWNVVDDCGAPGEPSISGIFTRDMQPRTAYFAMDDLVNREWKTKTTAKAAGGKVSFRGFKGRYRLSWKNADGKERSKLVEVE